MRSYVTGAPEPAPPTVIVTLAEARGSTPREAGAWMLVTAEDTAGTIGGGQLEWKAIQAARRLLDEGGYALTLDLPLGPLLQQCCGGHVTVALERVRDAGLLAAMAERARSALPVVALFGAGHVGRAVVRALAALPCRVRWADSRGAFPDPLPDGVAVAPPEMAEVPAGAFVLVMTHSHPQDLELVEAALRRDDVAWIGLIGSSTKRRRFEGQLRARGVAPAAIGRLVCPIGIRGIEGKQPAVIAASVAAQLLIAFEAAAARASLARSVA